ncbi:hypothetical protein A3768_4343 (plasmid) [Ralstonia solanacearum]|nr:hypothetical protein A3768_4343 [Ralstonia solanacearum]
MESAREVRPCRCLARQRASIRSATLLHARNQEIACNHHAL